VPVSRTTKASAASLSWSGRRGSSLRVPRQASSSFTVWPRWPDRPLDQPGRCRAVQKGQHPLPERPVHGLPRTKRAMWPARPTTSTACGGDALRV